MTLTLRCRKKEMRDQRCPSPTPRIKTFESFPISGFSSNWSKKFPLWSQPFWAGISVHCNWCDCKPAGMRTSKTRKFGWGEERRRAKQTLRAWLAKEKLGWLKYLSIAGLDLNSLFQRLSLPKSFWGQCGHMAKSFTLIGIDANFKSVF